ncbi:putative transcription regulator mTERF family [Lupinus albus]|uniref:Putative transcription regulator mTERF family n=1 Tax=Lupinus albus TaxID=3870 RepID=A0A6A4P477_LUPAL|nr:putative transcription regulator mTERF family [Lupinus albus]
MHNFLISRVIPSSPIPHSQFHLNLLRHNEFLFFNSFTSQSQQDQHKDLNFSVSYLITSCGFSPETATHVSKHVRFKTLDRPNAVLALLKKYGFDQTQIGKFVLKRPLVLVADAESTLLPKLKFYQSIGISTTVLPKLMLKNHTFLTRSLDKFLIPRYKILRSVVRSDEEVVGALKRDALGFMYCDLNNNFIPNINVLKELCVPQTSISILVMHYPGTAYIAHSRFVEGVNLAKELGFDPLKVSFIGALHVLLNLERAKWESRLESYQKWGWSREISLSAFRKFPTFMSLTEERFAKSMNFLVNDMGWPSEDIAGYPVVLAYSLEKRIIPRCRVIKILKSKGLIKNSLSIGSFTSRTEESFLMKYVTKFLEDVPLLLDVYKGLVDHRDLL